MQRKNNIITGLLIVMNLFAILSTLPLHAEKKTESQKTKDSKSAVNEIYGNESCGKKNSVKCKKETKNTFGNKSYSIK